MKRLFCLAVSLLGVVPVSVAMAGMLAGWDVNELDLNDQYSGPNYVVSAHTTATHLASAHVAISGTVSPSTTVDQYGFKISSADAQTTLAGAIAEGHYMEITLTANEPYGINLDSLELVGDATSTGCGNVAVLSSVDGYADHLAIASVSGVAGVTGGWDTDGSGFGAPISLTDSKYRELQTVTFRFYGWNSSSTSGAGVTRIRNLSGYDLVFNGTMAKIPRRGSLMIVK